MRTTLRSGVALVVATLVTSLLAVAPASAAAKCNGQLATITGTSGDDVIYGTPGRDVINAFAGNDTIYGYRGNDVICGGNGNDIIRGGKGNDLVIGGNGVDQIRGGLDDDDLRGTNGTGSISGGGGVDRCVRAATITQCENDGGAIPPPPPPPPPPPDDSCSHQVNALLVPQCGAWFGTTSRQSSGLSLADQEQILGDQFGAVRLYKEGNALFFNNTEQRWHDEGRHLVVSWKITQSSRNGVKPWVRVANGEFDDLVRRVARDIRDNGYPILFSLHHEPEDNVPSFGSNADYRRMFRHVHSIMEPIAPQQLVWFVNYRGWSTGPATQIEAMYPGDDVLDWISWNPYNWWGCHSTGRWKSMKEQARYFYDWARANHPNKPLFIGETGATEDWANPGRKAQWMRDMAQTIEEDYPRVRGVVWFQHTVASGFCNRIWQSSTSSRNAMRDIIADPYYGG
ncbi:MAG: calcium-binding protein [Acidimicrobiales bacterium]|nr:calcium-binding protein [Acidimicrobiales bacterium]